MTAFNQDELRQIRGEAAASLPTPSVPAKPAAHRAGDLLKLHLGCGPDKREGWINVDVNERFAPDLVSTAHELPMLDDESCAVIESCHLFEHLTLRQATAALREWRRLLAPGGELHLELPNLARCIELVGTDMNGFDLGMISLFGYPPEVDEQGEPQLHKWGWTPQTLRTAMLAAGFDEVEQVAITQTFRPAAKFDRDMRLVARVAVPAEVTTEPIARQDTPQASSASQEPDAPAHELTRVLAWPRYDDKAELDHFFNVFARVLEGRDDVVLFLRVDPEVDPTHEDVIIALDETHARILGPEAQLNVKLLEGDVSPQEWRQIGPMVACRIRSGDESAPRDAARQVPAPVAADAAALYSLINDSQCGTGQSQLAADLSGEPEENVIIPAGVAADPQLVKRIAELQPWFYPVTIDGLTVIPGLGSVCEPEWLASRAAHRAELLVAEVLRSIDMRGKSVLDLACNCAFWSSHYAEAGAVRVLGMEGRARHVDQARLYWDRGGFLAKGSYEFVQGNISDRGDWAQVQDKGPFDVTLCAGILYHVPNYADVLEWAAEVTNEVLIIDTRVQDGSEESVVEPGDLTFNAIRETREKVVPDRSKLLSALRKVGFEPEVLEPSFGRALGVDDVDSYADGKRITIIARKVHAAIGGAATGGGVGGGGILS